MSKTIPHIRRVQGQYDYKRKQVLYLTGMTDEELSHFQFDTGVEWLTRFTGDTPEVLAPLMRQEIIWKWWVNEWNRRDEQYLPSIYAGYMESKKETVGRYRALHQKPFIQYTPPHTLLVQAYDQAINDLNKDIQTKNLKNYKA